MNFTLTFRTAFPKLNIAFLTSPKSRGVAGEHFGSAPGGGTGTCVYAGIYGKHQAREGNKADLL